MEIFYTKIIDSFIVISLFVFIRLITNRFIKKSIIKKNAQKSRSQLISKAINFMILTISFIILLIIWGVKHSELAVFVGSVLTVVGVAMFAQWSLLSNITASIIIFFNHSVKIGDTIAIMESKDYEVQGIVLDIGLIFVTIKTLKFDEEITLPNNIFIQKTIRKLIDNGLVAEDDLEINTQPIS